MSKSKKASNILVYILMAMLIAGLGGFGISNFSGGGTTVATVGEEEITAEEYYRAMVQAVRVQEASGATDLSFAALEAQQIPAQVRGQLAATAALNNETGRLGLSVDDNEVARMITQSSSFQGVDGTFDREAYEYMLDQNGWTVTSFEETVRDESARNILQASVAAGVSAPDALVDTLTEWFGEQRSFRWVKFDSTALTDALPEPTDADLTALYEADEDAFTLPTMKRITYALLTPDMLVDSVDLDEQALRDLYAERADQYVMPERRLVERLAFGTPEEATAARTSIEAGDIDFPTLVQDRGLTLDDVDLGEVSQDDLEQAGDAVFGLTEPGIVGPYPTNLGPALFRMNGILSASETTFEEAEPELRGELGRERARRMIEDLIADMDDRLAGGATVEDLASETGMQLGSVDYWSGAEADIVGYEAFRSSADALTEDDFPEVIGLDDGGVFVMRLEETLEPRLQPLEDVRAQVIAAWKAARSLELLKGMAEDARAQLDVGSSLGAGGMIVQEANNATRSTFLQDGVGALGETVFGLEPGASALVDAPDGVVLVVLDSVAPANPADPQIALFRQAMTQQMAQGIASDLFIYYAQQLTATAGITFNDAALNAVHTQLFR